MKYIKLFKDTLEFMETLTDEQAGQIFKAIIDYSNDKKTSLDGNKDLKRKKAMVFEFKDIMRLKGNDLLHTKHSAPPKKRNAICKNIT